MSFVIYYGVCVVWIWLYNDIVKNWRMLIDNLAAKLIRDNASNDIKLLCLLIIQCKFNLKFGVFLNVYKFNKISLYFFYQMPFNHN